MLPEYRVNARKRSQDEFEKIKKYHQENYQKFNVSLDEDELNQDQELEMKVTEEDKND